MPRHRRTDPRPPAGRIRCRKDVARLDEGQDVLRFARVALVAYG